MNPISLQSLYNAKFAVDFVTLIPKRQLISHMALMFSQDINTTLYLAEIEYQLAVYKSKWNIVLCKDFNAHTVVSPNRESR